MHEVSHKEAGDKNMISADGCNDEMYHSDKDSGSERQNAVKEINACERQGEKPLMSAVKRNRGTLWTVKSFDHRNTVASKN